MGRLLWFYLLLLLLLLFFPQAQTHFLCLESSLGACMGGWQLRSDVRVCVGAVPGGSLMD